MCACEWQRKVLVGVISKKLLRFSEKIFEKKSINKYKILKLNIRLGR